MRACFVILLSAALAAAPAAAKEPSSPSVQLARTVELMKLPKDRVPAITFARPFVRVSPKGDRAIYIRRDGRSAVMYLRKLDGQGQEGPVPAAAKMSSIHWQNAFSGLNWRADGMRVAYLVADKDKEGNLPEPPYRLGVQVFQWDLPVAQAAGGGGTGRKDMPCCTSVTYSADGKTLWRALGDEKNRTRAALAAASKTRRKLNGVLYRAEGVGIYHLAPSPDGRHLAWIEAASRRGARKSNPSAVVVMDVGKLKIARRVLLGPLVVGPIDAPPPVWADGGKLLCYGDVVRIARICHREVHALDVKTGTTRLVIRNAVAVGATGKWLFLNRGPAVMPMSQMISSYAPIGDPRPRRDAIVACRLDEGAGPITILDGAYLQQVTGGSLIYATRSGEHILVMKAALKTVTGTSD